MQSPHARPASHDSAVACGFAPSSPAQTTSPPPPLLRFEPESFSRSVHSDIFPDSNSITRHGTTPFQENVLALHPGRHQAHHHPPLAPPPPQARPTRLLPRPR